ncbi:metallophosphoesterase [Paenibacillus sp. EPM92]|uniref:metallophosphoesterase family protein n=1 Tax=Paenibacillus sp. EPM92 TaxID=1561195 RepID=UPI001F265155|nr:metallophosphoesterase [Paenibacillus sp. EPM92]
MRKPLLSILAALILISALSVLLVANLPSDLQAASPQASASVQQAAPAPAAGRVLKPVPKSPPSNQPLLTFSVLSDAHVRAEDESSHQKLSAALSDLHNLDPNAETIILNGDMTDGLPEDYEAFRNILETAPLPDKLLYAIGNHEYYKAWHDDQGRWKPASFPNGETEQTSQTRFLQFSNAENLYFERIIAGYRFIVLGSEQYRQSAPGNGEDAVLSAKQLHWLDEKLHEEDGSGNPIFVFLHQPLPYTVAGSGLNRGVVAYTELKSILSKYPQVIFFSSHTHWELKTPYTMRWDQFTMINTSSVGHPLTDDGKGGETETAPEDSEGLFVRVFADRVEVRGRDFARNRWVPEAQFSVPVPGR